MTFKYIYDSKGNKVKTSAYECCMTPNGFVQSTFRNWYEYTYTYYNGFLSSIDYKLDGKSIVAHYDYTYDDHFRQIDCVKTNASEKPKSIEAVKYSYNSKGRIVKVDKADRGNISMLEYVYDYGSVANYTGHNNEIFTYSYDKNSNPVLVNTDKYDFSTYDNMGNWIKQEYRDIFATGDTGSEYLVERQIEYY
nr:hypothetical protein [Mucilaginibacter sp. X5P1]